MSDQQQQKGNTEGRLPMEGFMGVRAAPKRPIAELMGSPQTLWYTGVWTIALPLPYYLSAYMLRNRPLVHELFKRKFFMVTTPALALLGTACGITVGLSNCFTSLTTLDSELGRAARKMANAENADDLAFEAKQTQEMSKQYGPTFFVVDDTPEPAQQQK